MANLLSRRDKDAGNLITCAQFMFIAAEGFLSNFDFQRLRFHPRVIPWRLYFWMVFLFFTSSVLNNMALAFHISMPVHTVFRSSGLAGTLLTGWLFFGKRYSVHQIVSCMLVCVGIISLTLADGQARKLAECCGGQPSVVALTSNTTTNELQSIFQTSFPYLSLAPLLSRFMITEGLDLRWLLGICMLTIPLFMLAMLGHFQDQTYKQYGKVWREVMFYQHTISLPFFIFVGREVWTTIVNWTDPKSYATVILPGGYEFVASMFFYLAINLVTQSICFKGVAILTSHTSALTCTVALTLRKFVSLVLSIWYFNNPFTPYHWLGAILVFGGIFAYSNEKLVQSLFGQTPKKQIPITQPISIADLFLARTGTALSPSPSPDSYTPFSPSLPPHTAPHRRSNKAAAPASTTDANSSIELSAYVSPSPDVDAEGTIEEEFILVRQRRPTTAMTRSLSDQDQPDVLSPTILGRSTGSNKKKRLSNRSSAATTASSSSKKKKTSRVTRSNSKHS